MRHGQEMHEPRRQIRQRRSRRSRRAPQARQPRHAGQRRRRQTGRGVAHQPVLERPTTDGRRVVGTGETLDGGVEGRANRGSGGDEVDANIDMEVHISDAGFEGNEGDI